MYVENRTKIANFPTPVTQVACVTHCVLTLQSIVALLAIAVRLTWRQSRGSHKIPGTLAAECAIKIDISNYRLVEYTPRHLDVCFALSANSERSFTPVFKEKIGVLVCAGWRVFSRRTTFSPIDVVDRFHNSYSVENDIYHQVRNWKYFTEGATASSEVDSTDARRDVWRS